MNIDVSIALRILVLVLFHIRWYYWKKHEKYADTEKPKTKNTYTFYHNFSKYAFLSMYWLVVVQVLGLPLVQISQLPLWVPIVGVCLVTFGTVICIAARKEIAANWANGYEYQIKKKHTLTTSGIYAYIRHPIYLGLGLSYVGAEMVAGSWLWVSLLAFFIASYFQGRREEKLLLNHFGKPYQEYMKRTKMLIPWLI